jgi:alpha/beta superfamily hydrolase
MHTKALYRAAQALNDAGLVTLRFNFRGVGTSTGSHDDGVGEQDDVRSALDWLEQKYPHLPLIVGGFSFGSMVGLLVGADEDRVVGLLGLGLPVALDDRYDYGYLADVGKPGSGEQIAATLSTLGSHVTLVRISAADHFFTDRTDELRTVVRGYYESGPGARLLTMA